MLSTVHNFILDMFIMVSCISSYCSMFFYFTLHFIVLYCLGLFHTALLLLFLFLFYYFKIFQGDLARVVSITEGGAKALIQAVPRPDYTARKGV